MTTLPNLLTISRILVIPVIVGLFWLDGALFRWIVLGLYIAACVTDFWDGYLARARGQISRVGRFLDPVADKLLVATVILILVADGTIAGIAILPALVILCREIMVSGLREFLAELVVGLPVSRLSKWKTTIQMVTLGCLIMAEVNIEGLAVGTIGTIGLWISAIVTVASGYDYLRAGLRHMLEDEKTPNAPTSPEFSDDPDSAGVSSSPPGSY